MAFTKNTSEDNGYASGARQVTGLTIGPVLAVALISLVCGGMVGAYFLGFRAGHTNGLELALANNVAQVVRNPIAKSEIEAQNPVESSSDIYAKLKEPVAVKESMPEKSAEVSKEVKEFLEPAAVQKAVVDKESGEKADGQAEKIAAIQEKKQADTVAIQKALNEAKSDEIAQQQINNNADIDKQSDSIRVIGESKVEKDVQVASAEPAVGKVKSALKNQPDQIASQEQEDFSEPDTKPKGKKEEKPKVPATSKKANQEPEKNKTAAADKKLSSAEQKSKEKETARQVSEQPAASSLPPGWYSQVAAPRTLKEAQNMASRLRTAGFKSRIETAEVRDQKYFRVVVGPESSRVMADQVLMRLKKQTIVKTEPFIRMVR